MLRLGQPRSDKSAPARKQPANIVLVLLHVFDDVGNYFGNIVLLCLPKIQLKETRARRRVVMFPANTGVSVRNAVMN